MGKRLLAGTVLLCAISLWGCASASMTLIDHPEKAVNLYVQKEYGPEHSVADYYFGVGQSKKNTGYLAQRSADVRAMADLTTQLGALVRTAIEDQAGQVGLTEEGPLIKEVTDIFVSVVSESTLKGAKVVLHQTADDGRTVIALAIYPKRMAHQFAAEKIAQIKTQTDNPKIQQVLEDVDSTRLDATLY